MDDPAAASWRSCEFQLANWTAEEPAAADVWTPVGLPVPVEHYWPIDIFDSCSIQACVPGSRGAEQLVERCYYYSAASQHQRDGPSENHTEAIIDMQNRQEVIIKKNSGKQSGDEPTKVKVIVTNDKGIDARGVSEKVRVEFKDDMEHIKEKMHRYPAVLEALDKSYTVPRVVAIGPYHHHKRHLKKAEKVKHMAAIQCVNESRRSLEEVYAAVVSVAEEARSLYDKDVMAGIRYPDDFWHMMFFDACFLVQYILSQTGLSKLVDQSLLDFFSPNRKDIFQDITMLENQLPWKVLQTVVGFLPVTHDPIEELINRYEGYLQDQMNPTEDENSPRLTIDKDYTPPHLLGLLRHYTVGGIGKDMKRAGDTDSPISISISAMELAEIGINLKANKSTDTDLVLMSLQQEGPLFAELSLPPLSLDHNRASYLVNMAALELCTVRSFKNSRIHASAVCSYLQLLAMLVHREEDVHELRAKGVLQGGGGLTNQQVLSFFTSLQGQRRGKLYRHVMREIEGYKKNRWLWTKFYAFILFLRRHWGIIAGVGSAIGAVAGIIVKLQSIREKI